MMRHQISFRVVMVCMLMLLAPLGGCVERIPGFLDGGEPNETTYEYITAPPADVEFGDNVIKQYSWHYDSSVWVFDLGIPIGAYAYHKNLSRPPTDDYSLYVVPHPWSGNVVARTASALAEKATIKKYDAVGKVNFIASFVQNLNYMADNVTTPYDEYPRYPIETLYDEGGDCEDKAILMAAILDTLGYDVALIWLPQHMAVGISVEGASGSSYTYHDKTYFYLETTAPGWEVGELPEEYKVESGELLLIRPAPILVQEWSAWIIGDEAKINFSITNHGTADAYNVTAFAGFDAGSDLLWNAKASDPFLLEANMAINVTMYLEVPKNEYTRLVIQTVYNGYAVDTDYSEWFDT